jgi:UDP-2,3-diacylglucosamine pyrophosphatase LpxH
MRQKDYVNAFLVNNFETIQKARQLNGFSWKPIVQQLVDLYPTVGLDPANEAHRDRVRNIFLTIRKRNSPHGIRPLASQAEVLSAQLSYIKDTKIFQAPFQVAYKAPTVEDFRYTDTYNKPVDLPTNDQEEFALWKKDRDRLKNQEGMHIVIGCVHLPAHNKAFFNAFLSFLKEVKGTLKGIHLIGDIIDCKSLSQHDNGQIIDTTLDEEYADSNKALDQLDAVLAPGIEKNYFWGNHEERYARILKKVDISKFGKALISPTLGCRFAERGYTVQEDYKNAKVQLGKHLDLIHGDYVTQNSTKKHLDVYKKSIMFAHTHKMGAFFDCDKAAFNIGWMGDKENNAFGYVGRIAKSQWQNGFSVVYVDKDGYYHVQLIQYYNGRFVFGAREYRDK